MNTPSTESTWDRLLLASEAFMGAIHRAGMYSPDSSRARAIALHDLKVAIMDVRARKEKHDEDTFEKEAKGNAL